MAIIIRLLQNGFLLGIVFFSRKNIPCQKGRNLAVSIYLFIVYRTENFSSTGSNILCFFYSQKCFETSFFQVMIWGAGDSEGGEFTGLVYVRENQQQIIIRKKQAKL